MLRASDEATPSRNHQPPSFNAPHTDEARVILLRLLDVLFLTALIRR
jgi:hypothetical protein